MCLAIPGKIETISGDADVVFRTGRVSFEGIVREVSLACVPNATVGDYVLVHAGMAITKIDERAAKGTLAYLENIDASDEVRKAGR